MSDGGTLLLGGLLLRLLPLILPLCVLWPIFLPRYQLIGGASFEILMINGLKAAFNQALLRGEFPLWNEWVASGKVFLMFGAAPLSALTPLELILDPQVGKLTYSIELLLGWALVAWTLLRLAQGLEIRTWIAALGFFAYFLAYPMPDFTHWVGWLQLFVFGAALIILFALHLATGSPRLLPPSLLCAALLAPGVRPDGFPVLLILLATLSGLELGRAVLAGEGRRALVAFAQRAAAFVVLPLAFYAWQIPLVLAMTKASAIRFWRVETPIGVTLGHLASAVGSSATLRLGLAWGGVALGLLLLRRGAADRPRGRPAGLAFTPGVVIGFLLVAGAAWQILRLPAMAVTVSALMAGGIVFRWLVAPGRGEAAVWGYALVAVGIHSAFESVPLESLLPVPWKLSPIFLALPAAFLALVVYGAVAGAGGGDDVKSRLSRSLVAVLAVGWVWRDFLSLPLYEIANVIWPVERDFVSTSPAVTVLFLIGADAMWRQGAGDLVGHPAGALRWGSRLVLAGLAGMSAYTVVPAVYVPPGHRHEDEVWRNLKTREMNLHQQRLQQRADLFALVRQERGPDARIMTQLLDNIGFPGTAAGGGVRDAWGYDYVPDHYRELAERAFDAHDDLAALPLNFPRLIYYNGHAAAVYSGDRRRYLRSPAETPAEFGERLSRTYLRLQVLSGSRAVDPFLVELMRVGGLMLAHGAPIRLDGLEQIDPERDQKLWGRPVAYRLNPQRALRRFGFMPLGEEEPDAVGAMLADRGRETLARAYARVTLTAAEDAAAGARVTAVVLVANRQSFVVESDRPGFLVIFDGWHPDWRATVNGAPVTIRRAFLALRALPVPAGRSVVELAFEPWGWWPAVAISCLAMGAAGAWALRLMRSRPSGDSGEPRRGAGSGRGARAEP